MDSRAIKGYVVSLNMGKTATRLIDRSGQQGTVTAFHYPYLSPYGMIFKWFIFVWVGVNIYFKTRFLWINKYFAALHEAFIYVCFRADTKRKTTPPRDSEKKTGTHHRNSGIFPLYSGISALTPRFRRKFLEFFWL